ncbi:MAG: hypothetical protein SangKO_082580 [Sandaracinaceae bacterium]
MASRTLGREGARDTVDGRALAAYLAFFLSGASSLIFQTIWTRMLHHVFGATSVAISTVLTVFMAGLGLGAWLGGKYAHRIKHPIITYAVAEIGVGIWGLLIPLMVQSDGWLATVNAFLRAELGAESGLFMVARFLCVAPLLIVPTTLMGSTLPLLTRHFVRASEQAREAGKQVGWLYAINTFGASTGPLLSAFILLPTVGLAVTNVVACSMNFTLAAIIWIFRKPLLEGLWQPGEPLGFWPGTADASDVTVAASSSSETASVDEGEAEEAPDAEAGDDDASKAKKTRRKKAKKKRRAASAAEPVDEELPIPELARKGAFLAFAASGAAALCYEVVWSRALAMTIGSSIYSFALILETFLIGIAVGAAAMSAFLGKKSAPFAGVAFTSIVLVFLANIPWAVDIVDPQDTEIRFDGGLTNYLLLSLFYVAPIVLALIWAGRRASSARLSDIAFRDDEGSWKSLIVTVMAAIPVAAAVVNTIRFPGFLPQIIMTVVALVATFLVLASLLSRSSVLLVAIIQLFIAGATVASYIWQDEIPYAFAQLVVSIPSGALPDHVGQVQFFMFLTVVLCTLPATLGMGAMFPLVVRIWTKGGDGIARDVAHVYTGNTVGSIIGAWLPGFILFALIGAERTLHLGVALNMVLALIMLIVGAADPHEDQRWWSWRRLAAITLPVLAAVAVGATAYPVLLEDWRWWTRIGAAVGFLVLCAVEYQWLHEVSRTDRGGPRPEMDARAIAMVAVPTFAAGALAVVVVDPTQADSWALGAVYWVLRALLVLTGLVASWANWREVVAPGPAPVQTEEAPGDEADLPTWHAVTVYILSPLIPALLAVLFVGTQHPYSDEGFNIRWNLTQMTLGVFRVSLAGSMLEPGWGAPELVYYEDGLTTTVSVERWGRHYAMKNNGKVDASNGDDMPTQINVAAYPLLLHPNGPEGLDVAVIGFGSGVSVGTALQFPVARVDVVELERHIPEAARFFEDVNHLDYRLDRWPYVQMDRLTVINDDGRNYLASTRRQYDVIVSEPSNPWITGVSDLFTVDHWRITKQRLRPGGIYCQWVQLYELSPGNIKTIYRTFASQFEHVLVLSADDRSSDTVMLGSDQPIRLDLARVQQAFAPVECQDEDPADHCYCERSADSGELLNATCPSEIAIELERANVYTPFDIFARTLLATRDEVMAYTMIEERRREGGYEAVPASHNASRCEEPECRRRPAVLNTDDNAHIEFNAPRDLIGFSRYERYLSTVYSEQWPYGHPLTARTGEGDAQVPVLAGFGEGDDAARNYAELAMSMIAHGRYGWAGDLIERSQRAGRARETAVALEVLTHLLTENNEPAIRITPPMPGPEMDRDTAEQLLEGFESVRDSVDERAYGAALIAMENIPAPLRRNSGPSMRFLYGYLLYKAADGNYQQHRTAIQHLDELTQTDPDYVIRHPEVYYFLARAHDAEGNYGQSSRAMRAYVEARLVPANQDGDEVPEPEDGAAPTTDAPGESPKLEHDDRG